MSEKPPLPYGNWPLNLKAAMPARAMGLTSTQFDVYAYLLWYQGMGKAVSVMNERACYELCMARSTYLRTVAELIKLGLVKNLGKPKGGGAMRRKVKVLRPRPAWGSPEQRADFARKQARKRELAITRQQSHPRDGAEDMKLQQSHPQDALGSKNHTDPSERPVLTAEDGADPRDHPGPTAHRQREAETRTITDNARTGYLYPDAKDLEF